MEYSGTGGCNYSVPTGPHGGGFLPAKGGVHARGDGVVLRLHTGARVSVFDEEKRSQMTGTDVARFFNAIGRKAAVGVPGETTFPMCYHY